MTTGTAEPTGLAGELLQLAREADLAVFQEAWNRTIEAPPTEGEFYKRLGHALTKRKKPALANDLIGLLLAELAAKQQWRSLLRVVLAAAPFFPEITDVRKLAARAADALYAQTTEYAQCLEASGLKTAKVPVELGIKRLQGMLRLTPGRVYSHASFGEGIVRTMDLKTGKLVLDFVSERGRSFNMEGVKNFLTYRAPESFLALRATAPEKLRDMGDHDPVGLVKLVLAGEHGRVKQSELKSLFVDRIYSESQWSSWWTKARHELRADPMIDIDIKSGAHAMIVLRDRPRTLEEEVRELFFAPDADVVDRADAVRLMFDARKTGNAVSEATMADLLREVGRVSRERSQARPEVRLQESFVADDLLALSPAGTERPATVPKAADLADDLSDDYEYLAHLEPSDHALRALDLRMAADGDMAYMRVAKVLPNIPVKVASTLWRRLNDDEHRQQFGPAFQAIFDNPLRNPDVYFWALKTALDEDADSHLAELFPPAQLVPETLHTLEALQREAEVAPSGKEQALAAKTLLSKLKTYITARRFALVCRAAEEMTPEQVSRLRRQMSLHPAFNEALRAEADRQLAMTRRDVDQQPSPGSSRQQMDVPANVPPDLRPDLDYHWCTPQGKEARMLEMQELKDVKIPHNQAEIEKARAEGDLKENAGYQYAKEMQKVLSAQLARIQREISTSRPFDPAKVGDNMVGFGVQFTAENLTEGATENYSVFGMFEVDPDNNVISYQSPFAQHFLGRRIGEKVRVKRVDGREVDYQLTAIRRIY